jgi:hypothetical protein
VIAVAAASAISRFGSSWRGLGRAVVSGDVLAGLPSDPPFERNDPIARARKMMSRSAYLAAWNLRVLMRESGWAGDGVAYFLGVGASGGSMDDVTAMLAASIDREGLSLARLGGDGLAACNPLLAFQLMNNFTMCHGAIVEGTSGPSGALFSRGAGTTAALVEAIAAIESGECTRAIAGGADSALHPVTAAELARDGFVGRGLVPAEGAAAIAITTGEGRVVIEGCTIASGDAPIDEAFERAGLDTGEPRWLVIAPWGPPASEVIRAWAANRMPGATIADLSIAFGDALAASQALAWIAAIDLIDGTSDRAVVIGAGTDGDIGVVSFRGMS